MIEKDSLDSRDVRETPRKVWITPAIITGSVIKHSEGTSIHAVYEGVTDNLAS